MQATTDVGLFLMKDHISDLLRLIGGFEFFYFSYDSDSGGFPAPTGGQCNSGAKTSQGREKIGWGLEGCSNSILL
jgi:hypothetical protein